MSDTAAWLLAAVTIPILLAWLCWAIHANTKDKP